MRHFIARGGGLLIGIGLLAASLPLYESYAERDVLGRWSNSYAGLIVLMGVVWLVVAWLVWRRRQRRAPQPPAALLVNFGAAVAGFAYLLGSLENPGSASRILDLALFGSVSFSAPFLEWVALCLLTVGLAIWLGARSPARFHGILLSGAKLLVLLLLLEGGARTMALLSPRTEGFPTHRHQLWFARHGQTNSEGFRDREWISSPPPGTSRLLLLGDSYTFGQGIDEEEDRLGETLARDLAGAGVSLAILNAGVPDSHTGDHLQTLERTLEYRPDAVVLLYVFNDVRYFWRGSRSGIVGAPSSAWGRLHPHRIAHLNSHIYQQVYVRLRLIGTRRAGYQATNDSLYRDAGVMVQHFDDLLAMQRMAEEAGAAFAIVPFDIAVVASESIAARYARFLDGVRSARLRVWPVDRVLEGYTFDALSVNRLDLHPNELANGLLAGALIDSVAVLLAAGSDASGPGPERTP